NSLPAARSAAQGCLVLDHKPSGKRLPAIAMDCPALRMIARPARNLIVVAALFVPSFHSLAGNPSDAAFVGGQVCAGCHQSELALWRGSDHDNAMAEANDSTVLGDFNGTSFTHFGVTSTFYRKDGKFFVRTDGPDGALHDYEIAYTFGVHPLQQYLIA